MQDRVPLYPGRVKLTPVAGQENTYDMVRADQPTQVGTPLNKDSLLKDTTAALFGLGADAVPDQVLQKIKDMFNSVNSDIAAQPQIITGTYIGEYGKKNISLGFRPKLVLVATKNGVFNEPSGPTGGLALPSYPVGDSYSSDYVVINDSGFSVAAPANVPDEDYNPYRYMAVK